MGVRVELDDRNEKVGYKIREAQMARIPYMLIIGDRDGGGTVSVRARSEGDMGAMGISSFQKNRKEIAEKASIDAPGSMCYTIAANPLI